MKYLLFSDLHLGVHSANDVFLNASLKLADEIIECSKKNSINRVFFLGDFFHDRKSINLKTLDTAIELCKKFEEARLYLHLLCGNHDTYLKTSLFPNSLKIFEKFDFVLPVTEVTKIDDYCSLIPWEANFESVSTPYMFGHFEINGFDIDRSESFKYSAKDFKKFTKVFSGHFHTPKISGNIEYIGSVMPFTMHDVDSPRGFYELEIKSDSKFEEKFIEFTQSPKYKVIYSNQEIKEEDIKGNVVKLVYVDELSSIENEQLMQKLSSFDPIMVTPDFKNLSGLEVNQKEENQEELSSEDAKTTLALLYEYIDKIEKPAYIKDNVLQKMINQLLAQED